MNGELLSIQEAASILGVSTKTLRRWDKAGVLIPQRTSGNQRRYTKDRIDAFKKKREMPYGYPAALTLEPSPDPFPLGRGGEKSSLSFWERERTKELASLRGVDRVSGKDKFAAPNIFKVGILVIGFSIVVGLLTFSFSGNIGDGGLILGIKGYLFPDKEPLSFVSQPEEALPSLIGFGGEVLAESTVDNTLVFNVNIPSTFADSAEFIKGLHAVEIATLSGGIITENSDINAGTGTLTASNVLYRVTAGTGISVSSGQTPTITNTDLGSSQKIFKTIKTGSDSFSAGSNTDTLELAAGSNITLSADTSNKKITIAGSSATSATGWTDDGTVVRLTTSTDSVGIGTTVPSATFHVVGQCVTGDTILRRRRKKSKIKNQKSKIEGGWDPDDFEDVRIDKIQSGDEILSLDEATGEFVPQRIEKLMDMGIQEVFALVTQSGKKIETTGNHPYLTIEKDIKKDQKRDILSAFQVDQSPRIEDMNKDSILALANQQERFALILQSKNKREIYNHYKRMGKNKIFAPEVFGLMIVEAIKKSKFKVGKLTIDPEYTTYEKFISQVILRFYPHLVLQFKSIGRVNSPAHKLAYRIFTKKGEKKAGLWRARSSMASQLQDFITPGQTRKIRESTPPSLLSDSSTKWEKVKYLKQGMTIATIHGWEKISNIYPTGRKQTYDIQVRGTHSFVGNNIVAHNTYINSSTATGTALDIDANSLSSGFGLDISSTSTAGTASSNSRLLNLARSGANTNASHTAYGLYSSVTNTGTTSTNIGGYFTASGATNNYGLIVDSGNVGIGTTSPSQALHVVGQCVTGDSILITEDGKQIRVDEVKPGQKIYTLDQNTGQFVPGQVNALLDMGVKPTFKLKTASDKQIRTTGNHPYLVKSEDLLKEGYVSQKSSNQSQAKGNSGSSSGIVEINFGSHNDNSRNLNEINKDNIANKRWLVNQKKNLSLVGLGEIEGTINTAADQAAERLINQSANTVNQTEFIGLTVPEESHYVNQVGGTWTKVIYLKPGMRIAVAREDTSGMVWDEIVSIEYVGEEQVWDLSIEGTHNFVANGIVAHNTYINSSTATGTALDIDVNSLSSGFGLDISSTSTAGTGSSNSRLLNLARSGANTNASHTAYGLYSSATNTGTTSTNIGGYFTASGATNNYGLIVDSGNVGIGTTSPASALTIGSGSIDLSNQGSLINVGAAGNDWTTNALTMSNAAGASGMVLTVENTSNTATNQDARIDIKVGGISAGDPALTFLVPSGGLSYHMGIDNDTNDRLRIGKGTSVGTDTMIDINSMTTSSAVSAITLSGLASTFASTTTAEYTTLTVTPPTITLTGTTTVTSQMDSVLINAPTITDASAVTVDRAATFTIAGAPTAGGSVTINIPLALDVTGNASVSGNLTLYGAARSIQTTALNTLTLGGTTTGNIVIDSGSNLLDIDDPTISLATQATDLDIIDNTASALTISEATNNYLQITTTNGSEAININPSGVGQCVTGDSILITEDGERIRVDQVKAGQKVYTLDQKTGTFVPGQVNELLDMGVKPVFKLTTKSGKSIRTTGNHPYLTKIKNQKSKIKNIVEDSPIKDAAWVKVANLKVGDKIAVANSALGGFSLSFKDNKSQSEGNDNQHISNSRQQINLRKVHDILLLNKYPNNSDTVPNNISNVNTTVLEDGSIPGNTGDTIATPIQNTEKLIKKSATTESKTESNFPISNNFNTDIGSYQWARPELVEWDPIVSIEYVGEEQVYDLAIDGTHNFLANGIVAHNTYTMTITSDLSNGARSADVLTITQPNNATNDSTGNLLQLTQSDTGSSGDVMVITNAGTGLSLRVNDDGTETDSTPFAIDASGNVGIGTTSPLELLHVAGNATASGNLTLSGAARSIQTTALNTLTLGGTTTGNIVIDSGSSSLTLSDFTTNGGLLYTNGSGLVSQTGAGTTTTVLHGGTTPSYSAVSLTADVSGVLPIANGGTNKALTLAAGAVAYTDADSFELTAAGTSNQCLTSGGTGSPTWQNCALGSGTNWWDSTSGALYPINSTLDLLIGATATTSAKFAVLNVNSGTPTATVSANSGNNATYLTGDGTLATTNRATLTIGNSSTYNTTGNVLINPNGTGNVGIGTASPSQFLEVGGDVEISDGTPTLDFEDTTAGDEDFDINVNADKFNIVNEGTIATLLTIEELGRVGLGTTSPISELHVTRPLSLGASGKALAIFDQIESQDILTASASGTTRFTLSNAGNLTVTGTGTHDFEGTLTIDAPTGAATERLCQSGGGSGDGVALNEAIIRDCSAAGQADFAEYYGSDGTLQAGDVVVIDKSKGALQLATSTGQSSKAWVGKSSEPYQSSIIGIISTNPYSEVLSAEVFTAEEHPVPVSLNGRVPVKASVENGPIEIGDYLTSSSTPGVAMKATSAGQIVGKALEEFNSDGIGKIMAFVNLSWYDPSVYIAADGNLNTILSSKYEAVSTQDENSTSSAILDASSSELTTYNFELKKDPLFKDLSERVNLLETRINNLTETSFSASTSAILSVILASEERARPESLKTDSGVASLPRATIEDLDLKTATISGSLMVLGRTTLSDLGVTGNINAGLLAINGLDGKIYTLAGDLKLQSLGLGGIDILAGKVTIDTKGNVKISGDINVSGNIATEGEITAKKVNIDTKDKEAASIGSGVVTAGQTSVAISSTSATKDSKIFVTATTPTGKESLFVSKKTAGVGFIVGIEEPYDRDIIFDWWVVN